MRTLAAAFLIIALLSAIDASCRPVAVEPRVVDPFVCALFVAGWERDSVVAKRDALASGIVLWAQQDTVAPGVVTSYQTLHCRPSTVSTP